MTVKKETMIAPLSHCKTTMTGCKKCYYRMSTNEILWRSLWVKQLTVNTTHHTYYHWLI